MLPFLQSAKIRLQLNQFHLNAEQLDLLWDMPDHVMEVIDRIYAYEEKQAFGQAQAITPTEKFTFLRAWPLEKDTGILLYTLVKFLKPAMILECGTSFGVSGLFSASALQQNNHGHLITVEVSKLKHEAAWANFQAAQVDQYITQEKVAFDQYLKHSDQKFDLIFLDCDRSRYPVYFEELQPHITPNAIILADNALDKADDITSLQLKLDEYHWQHTVLPIGDGLLLAKNQNYGVICKNG